MALMSLEDVVMQLVGPIKAVGETNADAQRLANLKALTWLVERLLLSIHEASSDADRHEDSMKAIGTYARDFLSEVAK